MNSDSIVHKLWQENRDRERAQFDRQVEREIKKEKDYIAKICNATIAHLNELKAKEAPVAPKITEIDPIKYALSKVATVTALEYGLGDSIGEFLASYASCEDKCLVALVYDDTDSDLVEPVGIINFAYRSTEGYKHYVSFACEGPEEL
jgi:hypothetical protein